MKIILSNPSPVRSTRWISTPVPPVLFGLPGHVLAASKGLCVFGDDETGYRWVHALLDIEPGQSVLTDFSAQTEEEYQGEFEPAPTFTLEVHSADPHGDTRWESFTFEIEGMDCLYSDAIMETYCGQAHLGHSLCARLWVRRWVGQQTVDWQLLVTASRPSYPHMSEQISEMRLVADIITMDDAGGRGARNRITDVCFDRIGEIWDGQSYAAYGRAMSSSGNGLARVSEILQLVYPTASLCLGWRGEWGPESHQFGDDDPESLRDYVVGLGRKHADKMQKQAPTAWEGVPFGLSMRPSSSGDQQGFGLAKLGEALIPGEPTFLIPARYSAVYGLACRPVLHLEEDGAPLEPAKHPRLRLWDERVHWHMDVSPDRLGKGELELPKEGANGWQGMDDQHFSPLFEIGTYMLTGCPMLRFMLEAMCLRRQASQTYPSKHGNGATNDMNTPRALGRTIQAMRWLGWALPDMRDDLESIITHRVDECVAAQWSGRAGNIHPLCGVSDAGLSEDDPRRIKEESCPAGVGHCRPLRVEVDDRMPWGSQDHGSGWRPVFEAMGLAGLSWADLSGSVEALYILEESLASWLQHGLEATYEPWWGVHWAEAKPGWAPAQTCYDPLYHQFGGGAWGLWAAGFLLEAIKAQAVSADVEARALDIVKRARFHYITAEHESRIRGAEWIGKVPDIVNPAC